MDSEVFPAFPALRAATAVALSALSAGPNGFRAQTGASRFALAQVADQQGKAVVDIGVDDFVIQEAGAERDVLDVRVADYPIVLVVDNSRTALADFPSIRLALIHFVERLGPRPVGVITTGGNPKLVASFDDERSTLVERLGEQCGVGRNPTVAVGKTVGEFLDGGHPDGGGVATGQQ